VRARGLSPGDRRARRSLGCILYVMLSGLMPFWGATTQEVLESTCLGEYPLEGPEWEAISIDARDLIKRLIVVDPKERATCEDVFASPWIEHDHRAHDVHLAHFCANRRRYELKRTFKANVLAVIAVREFLAIAHRKRLRVPRAAASTRVEGSAIGTTCPKRRFRKRRRSPHTPTRSSTCRKTTICPPKARRSSTWRGTARAPCRRTPRSPRATRGRARRPRKRSTSTSTDARRL